MPPGNRNQIALVIAIVLGTSHRPAVLHATTNQAPPPASGLKPGLWETASSVTVLDIPGLPKALVDKMARDPNASKVQRNCLAESETTRPPASMFQRLGGECRYTSWHMAGGQIAATLTCTPPGETQGEAHMTLSGSHTVSSFDLVSTIDARDAEGVLQMHMVSRIEGKRAGDCP